MGKMYIHFFFNIFLFYFFKTAFLYVALEYIYFLRGKHSQVSDIQRKPVIRIFNHRAFFPQYVLDVMNYQERHYI